MNVIQALVDHPLQLKGPIIVDKHCSSFQQAWELFVS